MNGTKKYLYMPVHTVIRRTAEYTQRGKGAIQIPPTIYCPPPTLPIPGFFLIDRLGGSINTNIIEFGDLQRCSAVRASSQKNVIIKYPAKTGTKRSYFE